MKEERGVSTDGNGTYDKGDVDVSFDLTPFRHGVVSIPDSYVTFD